MQVHVSYPRPWDEFDESKNRPQPSFGQRWEIRAYETGGFVDSPGEYKEELGELFPYLEQATVWRNFKVELHGVMRRPDARTNYVEESQVEERR